MVKAISQCMVKDPLYGIRLDTAHNSWRTDQCYMEVQLDHLTASPSLILYPRIGERTGEAKMSRVLVPVGPSVAWMDREI